ncbi:doublecortin domain-containing protein 2C-like isoform X2 [Thalassophryne amazonica]|nr:doublecortin domain-containing protein 2C-like isoform X2 [Thalassophryne amazonica]XP_034043855.1 doublecortin domain-containing protein 2C-like isoform X2 [Thalassophryne amazonica]XP_034043856.1 doublecortin domain-containing protein 2C-like isoform X2 [Thalassophryne amazonica]
MESVISLVMKTMQLHGGISRLYTLDGHLIEDPKELKSKKHYVAVGRGKFKPAPYGQKDQPPCKNSKKERKDSSPAVPTTTQRQEVIKPVLSKFMMTVPKKRKMFFSINVYANGEDLVPPVHVKIPAYKMELLEDVITVVSEKMHLRVGVNGLYTVDGHPIKDPKELKNGGHYVAVCSGKFKPAQYGRDAPASCKSSKKECKALSPVAGTVHHEQTVHADAETVKTTDGAELKNMDVQEEPKPKTMELTIPFLSDVRLNVSKEENLSLQTPQRPIKLCQCLVEFLGNPEFKPITGEKTIDEDFVIDLIVVLLCSKDPMERKITKWVLKKIFEI